ncbi:hypothetical protein A2773_02080 [Candidatus Gottesmanbacteria bacterium RIFCSPHIGHO2_01_FULL_39_10]|uniref:Small ribosomal subunit protein bS20 n=1 Tax=Candidatus Gottesmanbacteria bacterium RIFCSPHIGHO2_01_FULL_39_10 TaxID=1798375 RepID=A0A1F5ZRG0_9BACT|nr:MAG: hypothetical protein A2773_02080 [Candidatus Gottesmanbacteria bacterium RIFCSPHIGHO2_01_FULL_39_10]
MPIIKSAKKKERQDKKRRAINLRQKQKTLELIRSYRKKPTPLALRKLSSALDLTAKKHIFHSKKAARLKSRLSKLLKKKSP